MKWDIHAFLRTKRDGNAHKSDEIRAFIESVAANQIPDYQIAAWLMAAYINGLTEDELLALTLAMATGGSGRTEPPLFPGTLDKHSTGGVGDTVTLLFLPICAAAGMRIVKLSGRGLGFTGGTLDKLESIPGFRTDLALEELHRIADSIGCAQGGQSAELAPADKTLYALRDAIEAVEHPALIASSVMSKKLATGAEMLVLDVKWGNGAFLPEFASARELARKMVKIGTGAGRRVSAVLTDMNQPLSRAIGNAIEVKYALDELRSGCKGRLGKVALALAQQAALLANKDPDEPARICRSGAAFRKALEWVDAQGGRLDPKSDTYGLPVAPVRQPAFSERKGFVVGFDTRRIGDVARGLGAGRSSKDDLIHPAVGIELHVEIGSAITPDSPFATVHAQNVVSAEEASVALDNCIKVSDRPPDPARLPPLVQTP